MVQKEEKNQNKRGREEKRREQEEKREEVSNDANIEKDMKNIPSTLNTTCWQPAC